MLGASPWLIDGDGVVFATWPKNIAKATERPLPLFVCSRAGAACGILWQRKREMHPGSESVAPKGLTGGHDDRVQRRHDSPSADAALDSADPGGCVR